MSVQLHLFQTRDYIDGKLSAARPSRLTSRKLSCCLLNRRLEYPQGWCGSLEDKKSLCLCWEMKGVPVRSQLRYRLSYARAKRKLVQKFTVWTLMNKEMCMQVLCIKALLCYTGQTKWKVGKCQSLHTMCTATFIEIPNIDPSKRQCNLSIIGLCHFNFKKIQLFLSKLFIHILQLSQHFQQKLSDNTVFTSNRESQVY